MLDISDIWGRERGAGVEAWLGVPGPGGSDPDPGHLCRGQSEREREREPAPPSASCAHVSRMLSPRLPGVPLHLLLRHLLHRLLLHLLLLHLLPDQPRGSCEYVAGPPVHGESWYVTPLTKNGERNALTLLNTRYNSIKLLYFRKNV